MEIELQFVHPEAEGHYSKFEARKGKNYAGWDRKTPGSAGFDPECSQRQAHLYAIVPAPVILNAGDCQLIGTGIAVWIRDPNLVGYQIKKTLSKFLNLASQSLEKTLSYVFPRSGLGHNSGINSVLDGSCLRASPKTTLGNTVGVIDSDYRIENIFNTASQSLFKTLSYTGEILLSLWNRSNKPWLIETGNRVAQLVIQPIHPVQFQLVKQFSAETQRGSGGFGHTGRT
jgi:dUTP pyrophosphatase